MVKEKRRKDKLQTRIFRSLCLCLIMKMQVFSLEAWCKLCQD